MLHDDGNTLTLQQRENTTGLVRWANLEPTVVLSSSDGTIMGSSYSARAVVVINK